MGGPAKLWVACFVCTHGEGRICHLSSHLVILGPFACKRGPRTHSEMPIQFQWEQTDNGLGPTNTRGVKLEDDALRGFASRTPQDEEG